MNKIYLVSACLLLVLHAKAQERKWQYRIMFDATVSGLVNVNKEPLDYIERKDYGVLIPHVQAGRKLNEKWTITAGLGFMRHRSSFRFAYEIIPRGIWYDYLTVPVGTQYKLLSWGDNKSWNLEGSIWNKFLVNYASSLPGMLKGGDPINIPDNPSRYVLNARLGTSIAWSLKNKHIISVAGFISGDMTPYLSRLNNSFMLTLRPSRYLFGGLGLSYGF